MSGILRRCAALLSSTALVGSLVGAPAADADDFSRVDRDPVRGTPLVLSDGRAAATELHSLRVADHASVRAYTATVDGQVRPHTAYVESAWSGASQWTTTPGATDPVDQAHWIVSHAYPQVDLAPLAEQAGLPWLEEQQAIAGTQAALWHVLEEGEPDPDANDPSVLALHEHLVRGSEAAVDDTLSRSLEILPAHVEEVAPDAPLGPLTVHSAGEEAVTVSVRGAPPSWLVDGNGEQVTHRHDGEQVYLDVDPSVPAGVVTLHVSGEDVPLPEGRLYTGRDGVRTRPLVTAEAGSAASSTVATLTWHPEPTRSPAPEPSPETAPPTPPPASGETPREEVPPASASPEATDRIPEDDLPRTGTWLAGLLVIAGALVVSGLIILVLGRKKRE